MAVALGAAALVPLVAALGLAAYLGWSAYPVLREMGLGFITSTQWTLGNLYAQPIHRGGWAWMPGAQYGAAVFLVGTGLTSGLALALATPWAFLVAAYATFGAPPRARKLLAAVVETMAGIPSVVYGLWGFLALAPVLTRVVAPALNRLLTPLPFVSGPVESETNLLVATVVLALMILPIEAATLRARMERTPRDWLDGARALGWTQAEVFWHLVWPYVRTGLAGAMLLGLGRALGETMAVLMVSGNALNVLPHDWYSPVATLAATIAGQLDSALTDPTGMAVRALGGLGLVLFALTVVANLAARAVAGAGPGRRAAW
ncbi:MAG: phosphate ABC transporter permease subunit PstC [Firmicutes bacterium]|nr:phosphate ABC transporter permease subunit PstC [Alicyclobacillaceae bacterium]MCL6496205.1 phosphate ABC transporter permease subunit PstC [Bacillota bacterium]